MVPLGVPLGILGSLAGQLGPSYDPLLYDLAAYATGFLAPAAIVAAVAVALLYRRRRGGRQPPRPEPETSFYECPRCHSPDVASGPGGGALCKKCGFPR